jgi:N-acetylgalactosamine 4-sulfate 6-O-sulfotransferase
LSCALAYLPACLPACLSACCCLQYFSLAATDNQVYAWGSNAYHCLGTGNSSVQELLQPTAVAGALGSGNWKIHGLAAGYQHAFAIADNPGDAALQNRQKGKAADSVASGSLSSVAGGELASQQGVDSPTGAGVEVVLTEKQQREREQYQQQQQQQGSPSQLPQGTELPAPAPVAGSSSSDSNNDTSVQHAPTSPDAAAAAAATTSAAGRDVAAAAFANQHISQHPSAAHAAGSSRSSECSTPFKPPPNWHTSYLPKQGPNLPAARDMWAAWSPSPWHNDLAGLSPDVFKLLPKRYNTQHKNPCWGVLGPDLSCLPYFNIIGVSKCGTTDLYHRLTLHKQILPATNKVGFCRQSANFACHSFVICNCPDESIVFPGSAAPALCTSSAVRRFAPKGRCCMCMRMAMLTCAACSVPAILLLL